MSDKKMVAYRGEFHILDGISGKTARAKCGREFPAAEGYPVTMDEAAPATARCETCLTKEAVEMAG